MPGGRKKYEPTEKDKRIVESMAAYGMKQDAIARVLEIDAKTLRKHFRAILNSAADKALAQVASTLFAMATSGKCIAATIFVMKCRGGFRETTRVEHSGPGGKPLLPIETARALLDRGAVTRPPEDEDEKPITN